MATDAPLRPGEPGAGPGEAAFAGAGPGEAALGDAALGDTALGDTTARASSAPADRLQLWVVATSHAVQHLYPAALAIAYPYVIATYHISYGTLGVILGAAGLVGGLLQGVAGLVETVSSRFLLGIQNLGLAAAIILGAVIPGVAAFAAARVGGSLVSWPQHPVGNELLVRRFPLRRAFVLAIHTAGGSLGTAVAPLITGVLIAAYGWRVGTGVFAIPMALGAVFVLVLLREPPRAAVRMAERRQGVRLRDVATRRQVVGALAAGTIAAAGRGLGTLNTYVPAYLKTGLHFGPVTVGALFTVLVVGSIVGPVVAGHAADRFGRTAVLAAVYVIGALFMALFVLVGASPVALGAAGLALGVFAYSESPLLQAVFADGVHGAPVRGAFGLYFAISYGVGALWLPLIGWMIDRYGFHIAFFAMAASFVASALVVVVTRQRGPYADPTTP